jgi:hypothetical protein
MHVVAQNEILNICYLSFLLQKLKLPHVLDVMHCEKNVCKNILKYLVREMDNPQVQNNMEEKGIRSHLYLIPMGNTGKAILISLLHYVSV